MSDNNIKSRPTIFFCALERNSDQRQLEFPPDDN